MSNLDTTISNQNTSPNYYGIMDDSIGSNNFLKLAADSDVIGANELYYASTPTWFKKNTEVQASLETKLQAAKDLNLEKMTNLNGYQKMKISVVDADTVKVYRDENDKEGISLRLSDITNMQRFDAVDSRENILASLSKTLHQPDYINKITGQDFYSLSPEQQQSLASNVKNYQTQQLFKSLTDPNYQFESYNNNKVYDPVSDDKVDAYVKVTGLATNDIQNEKRALGSIVNPLTGRDLTYDMANNPYLNSSYSMYNSIGNQYNLQTINKFNNEEKQLGQSFNAQLSDNDSRFGELIDVFQGSLLQSFAKFMSTDLAGALGADTKSWKQIAYNPDLAMSLTGVRQDTLQEAANYMKAGSDLIAKKDYLGAMAQYAHALDFTIASSLASGVEIAAGSAAISGAIGALSTLPIVGSVAAGLAGTSGATGAGLALLRTFLSTGLIAGTDQTMNDMHDYVANHNGIEMSASEVMSSWLANTAILCPDALLVGSGLSKFLPNSLARIVNNSFDQTIESSGSLLGRAFKNITKGGIAEGIQEPIQNAISEVNVEGGDLATKLSNLPGEFQGENLNKRIEEAMVAGMSGGALEGVTALSPKSTTSNGFQSYTPTPSESVQQQPTEQLSTADRTISNALDKIQSTKIESANDAINAINKITEITKPIDDKSIKVSDSIKDKVSSISDDILYKYISKVDPSNKQDLKDMVKVIQSTGYNLDDKEHSELKSLVTNLIAKAKENKANGTLHARPDEDISEESQLLNTFIKAGLLTREDATSISKTSSTIYSLNSAPTKETARLIEADVAKEATTSNRGHSSYYKQMEDMLVQASKSTKTEQRNAYLNQYKKIQKNADTFIDAQINKHSSIVNAAKKLVESKGFSIDSTIDIEQGVDRYGTKRTLKLSGKNLLLHENGTSFAKIYNDIYNHTHKALSDQIQLMQNMSDRKFKDTDFNARVKSLESKLNQLEKQNRSYLASVAKAHGLANSARSTHTPVESSTTIDKQYVNMAGDIKRAVNTDAFKAGIEGRIVDKNNNDISNDINALFDRHNALNTYYSKAEQVAQLASSGHYSDAEFYNKTIQHLDKMLQDINAKIDSIRSKEIQDSKNQLAIARSTVKQLKKNGTLGKDQANAIISTVDKAKGSLITEEKRLTNLQDKLKSTNEATKDANDSLGISKDLEEAKNKAKKDIASETNITDEKSDESSTSMDSMSDSNNTSLATESGIDLSDSTHFKGNKEVWDNPILSELLNSKKLWQGLEHTMSNRRPMWDRFCVVKDKATSNIYDFIDNNPDLKAEDPTVANEFKKILSEITTNDKYGFSQLFKIKGVKGPKVVIDLDNKQNTTLYNPNTQLIGKMLKTYAFNDAMQLIYDYNVETSPLGHKLATFSLNPYVAAAAHIAYQDYIANRTSLDKYDPDQACRIFGANPETTSNSDKNKFLERLLKNGTPLSSVANTIGSTMVEYLGIKTTDKSSIFDMDALKSSLGLYAIKAATLQTDDNGKPLNLVSISITEPSLEDKKNGIESKVPHIKFSKAATSKDYKMVANSMEKAGLFKESALEKRRPRFAKRKDFKQFGYQGIPDDFEVLTPFQQHSLEEQSNIPYELNKDMYDLIVNKSAFNSKEYDALRFNDDTKGIMDKLDSWGLGYLLNFSGWQNYEVKTDEDGNEELVLNKEFLNTHSYNDAQSQLGINSSVEREILGLLDTCNYTLKDKLVAGHFDKKSLPKDRTEAKKQIKDYLTSLGYLNTDYQSEFYFDRFQSKNGRTMMKDTLINPQANKYIQRFLIQNKQKNSMEFDPSDAQMLNEEAYAIGQAFDYLKNNTKVRALRDYFNSLIMTNGKYDVVKAEQLRTDFLASNSKLESFKTKYGFTKDTFDIGIENFAQCILVMNHLVAKAKAGYNNEGKLNKFNTYLAVENDSTTSGFAIRYFAFPDESLVKDGLYEKVGILFDGKKMDNHTLKKSEGFMDTYKDSAKGMYDSMFSNIKDLNNMTKEDVIRIATAHKNSTLLYKEFEGSNKIDHCKELVDIFKNIATSFPILDKEGKVTSEIRNMIKPVTMIFGYSAGETKLRERMAETIYNKLIEEYMKVEGNTDSLTNNLNPLFKDLEQAYLKSKEKAKNATYNKEANLYEALKNTDDNDIKLTVDGTEKTFRDFMIYLLGGTYGAHLVNYLQKRYHHTLDANTQVVHAITIANNIFYKALANEIKERGYEDNANIPTEEFKNIINSLKGYGIFPELNLIYNEAFGTKGNNGLFLGDWGSIFSGTHEQDKGDIATRDNPFITRYNKDTGKNEVKKSSAIQGSIAFIDENDKNSETFKIPYIAAKVKNFKPGGLGQAVETIHSIDGSIMQMVQSRDPSITSIYDAIEQNTFNSTEDSIVYNKLLPYISYELNLPKQYSNLVVDMLKGYRQKYGKDYNDETDMTEEEKNFVRRDMAYVMGGSYVNNRGKVQKVKPEDSLEQWNLKAQQSREDFIRNHPTFVSANFDGMEAYANVDLTKAGEELRNTIIDIESSKFNTDNFNSMDIQKYIYDNYLTSNKPTPNVTSISSVLNNNNTATTYGARPNSYGKHRYFGKAGKSVKSNILLNKDATAKDRIDILDRLQEISKNTNSKASTDDEVKYYKSLLSHIFKPITIENIPVSITNARHNNGEISISNNRPTKINIEYENKNKTQVDYYDKIAHKSVFSSGTLAETYTHEVTHAATAACMKLSKPYKEQIKAIRAYCSKKGIINSSMFIPKNDFNPKLKSKYVRDSKILYKYIARNNDAGLNEFVAYALTNPTVMTALRNHEYKPKQTLFNKVLDAFKSTFLNCFGTKKMIAENSFTNSVYGELVHAVKKANEEYADKIKNNKLGLRPRDELVLNAIPTLTSTIHDTANMVLKPIVNTVFNVDKLLGLNEGSFLIKGNAWHRGLGILKSALMIPFSESDRRMVSGEIRFLSNINHIGLASSMIDELSHPDKATYKLNNLNAYARNVDNMKKTMERTTKLNLFDAFDKPLNEIESTSLTTFGLMCDLQSFYDDTNSIDEIKSLVVDESKRHSMINTLKTKLPNENKNRVINLSKALGKFMVTNIGTTNLQTNPEAICYNNSIDSKYVPIVDKLASLYALEYTLSKTMNEDTKDAFINAFNTLSHKGLNQFFSIAKEHEQQNIDSDVETIEGDQHKVNLYDGFTKVKGKYKPIFNEQTEYLRSNIHAKDRLEKQGYKLIYQFNDEDMIGDENCLYQRILSNTSRLDGATWIYDSQYKIGESLKNDIFKEGKNSDSINDFDKLISTAAKRKVVTDKMMYNKELSFDDLDKIETTSVPVYGINNSTGTIEIKDIKLCTPTKVQMDTIGMDTNGINVLSSMMAKQIGEQQSHLRNHILYAFLVNDMKNMDPKLHMLKPENGGNKLDKIIRYKKITSNAKEKYIRDLYNLLPTEVRKAILISEESNKHDENKGLWVREDWLLRLFGAKQFSMADTAFAKTDPKLQHAVRLGEDILKTLSYLTKNNIVMKVPSVLKGNIVSNLMYSISEGHNAAKVIKYSYQNIKNINKYMKDKKQYDILAQRIKTGTNKPMEVRLAQKLKQSIIDNPVHLLVKKGMYQSVVEDMKLDDMDAPSRLIKKFTESKLAKMTPESVKKVLNNLYMNQGTPIYSFMYKATQFSDFVARCTEYQLSMEDVAKKYKKGTDEYNKAEEQISNKVWDAFINYDLPSHPAEQYLNDIGLLMFTKFAKRIQHVINNNIKEDPFKVLTQALAQYATIDVDDIYDQNLINKNLSALIHNPIDNAITAAVPMPIQFLTGMKKPL